ncbi:unnamed protein product [Acanthosepion pharaonis]|uniref:Uncharacterized protein n=1 Tax=Acanthosepion pharaonis TaxID=158019 RepID=A0A812D5R0_ACAPH|nr:unnamed protein product [Sepia pharaonis]
MPPCYFLGYITHSSSTYNKHYNFVCIESLLFFLFCSFVSFIGSTIPFTRSLIFRLSSPPFFSSYLPRSPFFLLIHSFTFSISLLQRLVLLSDARVCHLLLFFSFVGALCLSFILSFAVTIFLSLTRLQSFVCRHYPSLSRSFAVPFFLPLTLSPSLSFFPSLVRHLSLSFPPSFDVTSFFSFTRSPFLTSFRLLSVILSLSRSPSLSFSCSYTVSLFLSLVHSPSHSFFLSNALFCLYLVPFHLPNCASVSGLVRLGGETPGENPRGFLEIKFTAWPREFIVGEVDSETGF